MRKEHIIFSQKLTALLMLQGFVLKRMEKTNKDNKKRNIFIFNESDDLLNYIKLYKNNS